MEDARGELLAQRHAQAPKLCRPLEPPEYSRTEHPMYSAPDIVGFHCHLIVFYVIRLLAHRWSWEGLGWWCTYMAWAAQKQTPRMEAAGGKMG